MVAIFHLYAADGIADEFDGYGDPGDGRRADGDDHERHVHVGKLGEYGDDTSATRRPAVMVTVWTIVPEVPGNHVPRVRGKLMSTFSGGKS